MTSTDADYGLLSPHWVGSAAAAATSDEAVFRAMLDVEIALVESYADLGMVSSDTAQRVRDSINSAQFDVPGIAERGRAGGNPVIPLVKDVRAAVAAADPDAAAWVHRGATSQDILDTALMLVAQRAIGIALLDCDVIADGLAALAHAHRRTVMASRTLTQHGVPTTFGLKAAGWLGGLERASRRLRSVARELPVQWGGAGGTLASFTVIGGPGLGIRLSESIADRLGLHAAVAPWQTQRAAVTELGDALTQVTDALGKLSSDVLLLARPEFGELSEPAASGRGGSSAMPQKQNPVLSVLVQAAARKAPGLAAELHRSANAVDERPEGAWHVEWAVMRELLRATGGALALASEMAPGLVVHANAMKRNLALSGPLVISERLMLEFGPLAGGARIQELVSLSANDPSYDLASLLRAEPALAVVGDHRLAEILDPANYLGDADALIDRVLAHHAGRESA
ncbi:MAG: 3-carboxy-cis,cis-muconate cycloisomerase [Homoserinimonas sp.]|nr:3-carboxy-cis,cis-muconate cycloisomerase [Homoserinimonas sp.]